MTRRFRRRRPHRLLLLFAVVIAAAARLGCLQLEKGSRVPQARILYEGSCEVVRVVDGDTLIVRQASQNRGTGNQQTVEGRLRLLGIDCPESVKPDHPVEPWGPEASDFTRKFLDGGDVQLRFDKRRQDRFGRFLAYVHVGNQMLNVELVRAGFARVSTFPGDSASVTRTLRVAEQEARDARRGIWSKNS